MNMESVAEDARGSGKGQKAFEVLRGALRPILGYLDAPSVQEIMINAPEEIWIESEGIMRRISERLQPIAVELAVRALATSNDKRHTPIMDARLPGIRVAAVMYPVAINGHAVSIRKHAARTLSLDDYVTSGAFSPRAPSATFAAASDAPASKQARPDATAVRQGGSALRDFFVWAVARRKNLLVAGGTSSGKTTLINALLDAVPPGQRVITIEDTAELRLASPNRVAFEANRELDADIRALVRVCLRFRPDRSVVGEIRGGEAYDLVDSLNTGHSGGITSIHADTAESAFDRLETLMRMAPDAAGLPHDALRRRIAQTFSFVVQTAHLGGDRGPVRVVEVLGYDNGAYRLEEVFSRLNGE